MFGPRLFRAVLTVTHRPTGATRHYGSVEGAHGLLPPPAGLEIYADPGGSGFYLIYLNADGEEQTDTWHPSLDEVFEQARFEFGIERPEWAKG